MDVSFVVKISLVVASLLAALGASLYFGKDDNPVEEVAEYVIEQELGVKDVDLTPNTPEK